MGGCRESSGDNGRECGRGGAVRFFRVALNEILFGGGTQLGNIRTRRLCERAHTAVQRQADTGVHKVFTTTRMESLYSLCLSVSFFTSLPFPGFFSQHTPAFVFPTLPVSATLLVKGTKGLGGVAGFWTVMSWERATGLYRQPLTGQH